MDDPFHLQRFLGAQARDYETALAELRGGEKRSHWIWYVFPQIAGLGFSPTSAFYAITSLDEARAYLAHPVLGARLRECVATINGLSGRTAQAIFHADDVKVRSSLTLFAAAAPDEPLFAEALARYFGGERDPMTLAKL
ncbi:MAG TPA: DUF1810 domain-containing protein [Caulobacteraceae bacterium]|jgi:uncharacterized protein (DUF1810 family)